MSTASTAELSKRDRKPHRPRLRRWSAEEFHRTASTGVFDRQRLELIDGGILEMLPLGYRHVVALTLLEETLRKVFGKAFWVRSRAPLRLSAHDEPVPDLSVIRGRPTDFSDHPQTAVLVVEVSDTTLAYDLQDKASLYARAGIEDYWVLDLRQHRLHVFRSPGAVRKARFGSHYAEELRLSEKESIAPLAAARTKILVARLLPKTE